MVIAAVVPDAEIPARFLTPAYIFRSSAEIVTALETAGLSVEVHLQDEGRQAGLRWFRAACLRLY